MPTILRRKHRRGYVGDLRERVTIQNRAITPPDVSEFDLDHDFTTLAVVWASVETASGDTVFDGIGQDQLVTHRIVIRHLAGVTSESWVVLKTTERLKILSVEAFEERGRFMLLTAQRTGTTSQKAGQA